MANGTWPFPVKEGEVIDSLGKDDCRNMTKIQTIQTFVKQLVYPDSDLKLVTNKNTSHAFKSTTQKAETLKLSL